MGERKVINKYYPPDFDPAELEKHKKPKLKSGGKRRMVDVRMMLPMSVRCQACGEYMYKGKKFNSQKETVEGEDYCGIKVYRIYFKCVRCKTTFTIKTDPKNADYVCELNVTRNMEPRKDELKEMEHEKKKDKKKKRQTLC
ncbi:Splicing factor YJU2 [Entamoeba marina]